MIAAMRDLPQALYTAQAVRELDRLAIEQYGIAGLTLMTRAGEAVFRELRRRWPRARRVAVVCGAGNNGGDGFVVARLLYAAGLPVTVSLLGDAVQLKGDARLAYEAMTAAGLNAELFSAESLRQADVVVDALFGTGLDREPRGLYLEAITAINNSAVPVIAVDIPSGLHADTGAVLGAAVRARVTVSFIGLKQGLFTGEGPAQCGEIVFDDLAISPDAYNHIAPTALLTNDDELAARLPRRDRTAHKGRHGHVLIVGGDAGMAGAARMAAQAAARVGAGLVSIATHPRHAAFCATVQPEIMCHAVADGHDLRPLLQRADVVAVGPGLGTAAWGKGLFDTVLDSGLPLVVDADALNLLAQDPARRHNWVLTPHPGEAARLLEMSVGEIQSDRFTAVRALAARYDGVAVLKGAGSLIAGTTGPVAVCAAGNPGMATGGMGDVLTGVIAGLVAQGLGLPEAARLGVHLHARAGDAAACDGERGMLATDLLPELRYWVNPDLWNG